jgi:hypothetical protein
MALTEQSYEDQGAVEVVRKHILADYQNHKVWSISLLYERRIKTELLESSSFILKEA